jgi:hypothetical protein
MVKTSLVESDLLGGRRLLIALHIEPYRSLFRVKAAFWLYYVESQEWRFVIATPVVDEQGPLKTYTLLQPVLQQVLFEIQPADLSLQNVAVIGLRDPLAKAFRGAMRLTPKAPYVRMTKSTVGGEYIEDAYVYTVPPPLI